MKKIFLILIILNFFCISVYSAQITGGVSQNGVIKKHQIIDANTQQPLPDVWIALPQKNFKTKSDADGRFDLNVDMSGATILSVKKDGYRPFSLTINEKTFSSPLVIGIEKSNATDIVIDSNLVHLGDDNFSKTSANSSEFKTTSIGPRYFKDFIMKNNTLMSKNYIVIGTIIGIDSLLAKKMGQNRIVNSYASPPEVYFNNRKIAEIHLNGDRQKIKIPNSLIKPNQVNRIMIKTGHNVMQTAYVDYDDIEIMNLSIFSE